MKPEYFIFNDFSLDGQFENVQEFCEHYLSMLITMLDTLNDNDIGLLKAHETYNRLVTKDMTLMDLITRGGDPYISAFLNSLVGLVNSPFWSDDIHYQHDSVYEYDDKAEEPNCITEAIERKADLLASKRYNSEYPCVYTYKKDGNTGELCHHTSNNSLLLSLLQDNYSYMKYAIEHYSYSFQQDVYRKIVVDKSGNDALIDCNLNNKDLEKILINIGKMAEDKLKGIKSHWWDSLGDGYNEYRVSVSDGREFRWYFIWDEKLVFLNPCIKKTQKTENIEKKKMISLAKNYSFK